MKVTGDCNDGNSGIHPGASENNCNGVDDDCDSAFDEGWVPSAHPTSCGVGACYSTGMLTCSGGATADTCTPGTPSGETCNNIDDDCDGSKDESLSQACYTGAGGTENVGLCHGGTWTCSSGVWGPACSGEVVPATEIADGKDNDCDGSTDEIFACTPYAERPCYTSNPAEIGIGVCTQGVQSCKSDGNWDTACNGETTPSAEICNGHDDDCEGTTDQGFGSTTCGIGACSRTVSNCLNGETQTCVPGSPITETCNGADDDCDGYSDEGCGPGSTIDLTNPTVTHCSLQATNDNAFFTCDSWSGMCAPYYCAPLYAGCTAAEVQINNPCTLDISHYWDINSTLECTGGPTCTAARWVYRDIDGDGWGRASDKLHIPILPYLKPVGYAEEWGPLSNPFE